MIVIVMGVAGAGKTAVGERLAADLGWRFIEGDAFHPPENVDKIRRGIGLDDADRAPWLARLEREIRALVEHDACAVLACSALKRSYRDQLRVDPKRVRFVYLRCSPAVLEARLRNRRGHFAGPALLPTQLETLEEPSGPEDALCVDGDRRLPDVVAQIRERLGV
jgi:gluconokinase